MDLKQKERRRNRCVLCAMIDTTARSAGQEHKRAISISTTNKTCARQSTADCVASTHSEYLLCAAAMPALGGMIPVGLASARRKI
jgi:hypothetical protein